MSNNQEVKQIESYKFSVKIVMNMYMVMAKTSVGAHLSWSANDFKMSGLQPIRYTQPMCYIILYIYYIQWHSLAGCCCAMVIMVCSRYCAYTHTKCSQCYTALYHKIGKLRNEPGETTRFTPMSIDRKR